MKLIWQLMVVLADQILIEHEGRGVQHQKRQRTSCDFPNSMIFFNIFSSLFEVIS